MGGLEGEESDGDIKRDNKSRKFLVLCGFRGYRNILNYAKSQCNNISTYDMDSIDIKILKL